VTEITLHHGDNRDTLRRLIDKGVRVHSVVTDPPYGLTSITKRFGKDGAAPAKFGSDGAFSRASAGFMGSRWDGTGIERDPDFWRLIHDILLPGGYVVAFSGSRTGHWQACAMEMAGFIIHPFLGWVYGCLDDQSECLTRRGWLRYTDIVDTDEVLQWDSATGRLSWVHPEHVHEYPFDGEMVMVENRHTQQMLTPNHRVYGKVRRHSRHAKPTEYEVVLADNIDRRPSNWQVDLPMAGDLVTGSHVDPAFAYIVGWWLTDAWAHRDGNACMFSQCKPRTLERLRAALEPHGASEYVKAARSKQHADEHSFYLTGPIAERLRAEFPNRILNWEILSWSKDARLALYEGLMDGDGSRPDHQHAEAFWSTNQDRRDVFVALALTLGYRAYDDPKKGVVYVNPKSSTTQIQGKHRSNRVQYAGNVWCLTVPTGAFVARRNGRPFITGNSGFPKAHNAAMAIDKQLGVSQGFIPEGDPVKRMIPGAEQHTTGDWTKTDERQYQPGRRVPGSPEAAQWEGWAYGGQALKPALEPIFVGQKPFSEKNGALNLLKHGVGAINIDGCRVSTTESWGASGELTDGDSVHDYGDGLNNSGRSGAHRAGRHPGNLLHDGSPEVVALFPDSGGQRGALKGHSKVRQSPNGTFGTFGPAHDVELRGDAGSAARFFNSFGYSDVEQVMRLTGCTDAEGRELVAYLEQHRPVSPEQPTFYQGKATKADRAGSKHPTVKPVSLMQWLVRLVTPVGGTVLDPFAGSGTTGEAARREGFNCVLMEAEDQFAADIRARFDLPSPADNDDFDSLTACNVGFQEESFSLCSTADDFDGLLSA